MDDPDPLFPGPTGSSSLKSPVQLSTAVPLKSTQIMKVASRDGYTTPENTEENDWSKPGSLNAASSTTSFQIDMAECVETKTVTTTTTTKRQYPPLFIHAPKPLDSLDTKKYPLAAKPTPKEISSFSYVVDGETVQFHERPRGGSISELSPSPSNPKSITLPPSYHAPNMKGKEIQEPHRTRKTFSHGLKSLRGYLPKNGSSKLRSPESFLRESDSNDNLNAMGSFASTQSCETDATLSNTTADNGKRGLMFAESFNDDRFDQEPSPSFSIGHNSFPSAVATPPVAESDLEPFAPLPGPLIETTSTRPATGNAAVATRASLPSPGLSPTLAAANATTHTNTNREMVPHDMADPIGASIGLLDQYQTRLGQSKNAMAMHMNSMLENFDSMPDEMKTFMMYQMLRRCSKKTLHVVASVVNPALRCDFLEALPVELSLHILSFLDVKDLCKAAQVSKRWRNLIDTNEAGWKNLMKKDGYVVPMGELERAVSQGWGWQDPHGNEDYEKDISQRPRSSSASSSDRILMPTAAGESSSIVRHITMKRKRDQITFGLELTKRRAVCDSKGRTRYVSLGSKYQVPYDGSEGPNAAAAAAALAVPNPELGLPTLRELHLFKSLYRRRYMLKKNWMDDNMSPRHVAFPAHPRHVITCLQFDDDKIITGSDDTFIHVYDTATGQLRKRLEGHEGGVWALQYEGNILVSGSTDRSVRVWDIERGMCTQVFSGHTSTVRCLQIVMPTATGSGGKGSPAMMPEKPLIITGSRDAQLRVWKLPDRNSAKYTPETGASATEHDNPFFVRLLAGHSSSVRAIAAHQDTLVSGSYDNTVRVWKISTGESIHKLQGHLQKVYSVVLDHKRNRCISGSMDNTVKIWSLETGACLYTLEGHSSLVGLLDLKDDRLVSAAADSTLRIWNPENGVCKNTLTAHTGAITCFQHDGQKVISGSDRTLKMWNVKTGECMHDLLTDLSGVWQVKFDERRCVAAVQRDGYTFIEVLDFGASRDGIPSEDRGRRIVLEASEYDRIPDDDAVQG